MCVNAVPDHKRAVYILTMSLIARWVASALATRGSAGRSFASHSHHSCCESTSSSRSSSEVGVVAAAAAALALLEDLDGAAADGAQEAEHAEEGRGEREPLERVPAWSNAANQDGSLASAGARGGLHCGPTEEAILTMLQYPKPNASSR